MRERTRFPGPGDRDRLGRASRRLADASSRPPPWLLAIGYRRSIGTCPSYPPQVSDSSYSPHRSNASRQSPPRTGGASAPVSTMYSCNDITSSFLGRRYPASPTLFGTSGQHWATRPWSGGSTSVFGASSSCSIFSFTYTLHEHSFSLRTLAVR